MLPAPEQALAAKLCGEALDASLGIGNTMPGGVFRDGRSCCGRTICSARATRKGDLWKACFRYSCSLRSSTS